MSMRKQVYEWNCGRFTAPAGALPVGVNNNIAGQPFSIFYGGFGNNIPTPAHTEPHQFVVIEKYGVTPTAMVGNIPANTYRGLSNSGLGVTIAGPRAYLQVRINTRTILWNRMMLLVQGCPERPYHILELHGSILVGI